jgi:hypothetical protein
MVSASAAPHADHHRAPVGGCPRFRSRVAAYGCFTVNGALQDAVVVKIGRDSPDLACAATTLLPTTRATIRTNSLWQYANKRIPPDVQEFFREQGAKGGKLSAEARMRKLTPEQRSEIARKGSQHERLSVGLRRRAQL